MPRALRQDLPGTIRNCFCQHLQPEELRRTQNLLQLHLKAMMSDSLVTFGVIFLWTGCGVSLVTVSRHRTMVLPLPGRNLEQDLSLRVIFGEEPGNTWEKTDRRGTEKCIMHANTSKMVCYCIFISIFIHRQEIMNNLSPGCVRKLLSCSESSDFYDPGPSSLPFINQSKQHK